MVEKRNFDGNIPVLMVEGQSLAETWEKSMLKLYNEGGQARTEYDSVGEGYSRDCTMVMVVKDPTSDPFIHRAFPGGLEDLEEYRQEVLDGIKAKWIRDPMNPGDDRWEYTYWGRLFRFDVPLSKIAENTLALPPAAREVMEKKGMKTLLKQPWAKVEDRQIKRYDLNAEGEYVVVGEDSEKTVVINQLEACVSSLIKSPHTRRAQAITWKPWEDLVSYDPACLQSIWLRVGEGDDGTERLNMDVRFRSRDAYDAAFMNCYALVHLQERLAGQISAGRGKEVKVGRYADMSDSYHIYGRRLPHFKENFMKQIAERTFEDRTWSREFASEIVEEAKPKIAAKVAEYLSRKELKR